jgi:hypothetical protein
LSHAFHADQVLLQEHGNAVGQQTIQDFHMGDAKIGQRVVIEAHATAQPLKGDLVPATAVQLAGAADATQCRVQPQGQQNAWIGGRGAGAACHRLDLAQQVAEVKALDKRPNRSGRMVLGQQRVQATSTHLDLLAVGVTQAWRSACRRLGRRQQFAEIKQRVSHRFATCLAIGNRCLVVHATVLAPANAIGQLFTG